MLRFFVLALVLINCMFFGWSQGLLLSIGFGPAQQTEPQRVNQQIKPDAIELLDAQHQRQTETALPVATKPAECLRAGLFDEAQAVALREALTDSLAAGSWVLESVEVPARWIVYMGKFANDEAVTKKRNELTARKLTFEPLTNPDLQLGLSLGGFQTRADAEVALSALNRRGVRTARVVLERAQSSGLMLRLPATNDAMRARLEELKPLLGGKQLQAC